MTDISDLAQVLDHAAATAGPGQTIRACAMAYFDFAQSQPATFALMFDPNLLAEVPVERDAHLLGFLDGRSLG